MTHSEFNLLSPQAQEDFINTDGVIVNDDALGAETSGGETTTLGEPSLESSVVSEEKPKEAAFKEKELPDATEEQKKEWTEGFDILDPVELLFLVDDRISSGKTNLHPWQVQFMLDFANENHTKDAPFNAEVQACNGSGKDKFILAACIVWLCMRFKEATGVATNGSGVQLDTQTERHVSRLCEMVNKKFGTKVWKCNYREYRCLVTGSLIILFATDEANKAEGFHPIEDGRPLAIFASEAKAVPDTIFSALTRCLGVTHAIDVSSPGLQVGYFYDRCMAGIPRKDIENIKTIKSVDTILYHITAYDCPHISDAEIEAFASKLAGGKTNATFRSGILSEFGDTDEKVVIPTTYVMYASNPEKYGIVHIPESFNTAGLDLSDGGAENVLIVRNGNKVIHIDAFRFPDTEDTIEYLDQKFKEYGLTNAKALIFGDCCGIGKPMLNSLRRRKKWTNIRYIDSRNAARDKKVHYNRGTELFFNMRLLMEHKELIIPHDKLLKSQLSSRFYKTNIKMQQQLLSKEEQRSKGYASPDRADALNLAFWNYKSTWTGKEDENKPFEEDEDYADKPKVTSDFDMRVWSKGGRGSMPVANGGIQDFSELENAVKEHNARVLAQRNN